MEKRTEYQLTEIGLLLAIVGLALICISETRLFFPSIPSLSGWGTLLLIGGFVLVFLGRKRFGDLHEKYVVWSGILLLIGIVVIYFRSKLISILSFGAFFGDVSTAIRNIAIVYGVSFVLTAIFVGISLMLLIWALENKSGKIILFGGFSLGLLVTLFLAVMFVSMFATVKTIEEAMATVTTIEIGLTVVLPFAITHYLLYIAAYFMAYIKVKNERKKQIGTTPPTQMYPPWTGALYKGKPFYKVDIATEIGYVPIPKMGTYEAFLNVICPRCEYEHGTMLLLESADKKEAKTTCPRCKEEFYVILPA